MRVQRYANLLALGYVPGEVLDLICVDIRGCHLNCGREVENDRVLLGRFPLCLDSLANSQGKVQAGVREGLRAELESPLGTLLRRVILGQLADQSGALLCQLNALVLCEPKYYAPEAFARGEVDMYNSLLGAPKGFDRSSDEVLAARGEDLEVDIVGACTRGLDQAAGEIEVGLRCRRK